MSRNVPRIMLIAGEASGDHYGGGLVKALLGRVSDADIFGMGGMDMRKAGMEVIQDINGLDVMGFWDVITRIFTFKKVFSHLKAQIETRRPDAVVLIDYPGFNIRFAHAAHEAGIPVVYFISPKVWAWKAGRIKKLEQWCDKMLVFFDFEREVFRSTGLDTVCIGHPLISELKDYRENRERFHKSLCPGQGPVIGLVPGSRQREIKRMFPVMLDAAMILKKRFPEACFPVACAPSVEEQYVRSFVREEHPEIDIKKNSTREIMAGSDVCAVTSGTATLETGIINTPHVVCYRLGFFTYFLVKPFIRINNVGLVNIAAGAEIMPELIQFDLKPGRLADELEALISDEDKRKKAEKGLKEMTRRLKSGEPYLQAAEEIMTTARRKGTHD